MSSAEDICSVISLAQYLGYKPKVTGAAITTLSVYQLCKADAAGDLDTRYLLRISSGLTITSVSNSEITFRTVESLDFSDPTDREISVYNL